MSVKTTKNIQRYVAIQEIITHISYAILNLVRDKLNRLTNKQLEQLLEIFEEDEFTNYSIGEEE